jgi:hypothetical protein
VLEPAWGRRRPLVGPAGGHQAAPARPGPILAQPAPAQAEQESRE